MNWLGNPYRHVADDAEELSHPPNGGRTKPVVLGVLLPLAIGFLAIRAWLRQEAIWFGEDADMPLVGPAARSMAVVYFSVALFCHFRWFWGLIPVYRIFEIGTVAALLGFLGGLGFATYYVLF